MVNEEAAIIAPNGGGVVKMPIKAHYLVIPPSRSPADLAAYRGPRKTFPMADKTAARTRAETHFSASEARDQLVKTELAKELGCGSISVCKVGSHDTASAVASVPAPHGVKWAYISCGTWALLGSEADNPTLTKAACQAGFTNEGGLNGKIRFLSNITGLWLIQETRRVWSERKGSKIPFAEIAAMAEKAEPRRFLVNPNSSKFLAPGDFPARIREYCAETNQGTPDDNAVVRCIYDSLALCFRAKLEQLQKLTGKKYDTLQIVGGGTQAKILMKLAADAVGIPVLAGPVEATAIGNILSQAMADGKIDSLEEARAIIKNSFELDEYAPSKTDRKAWDDAFARFVKLP